MRRLRYIFYRCLWAGAASGIVSIILFVLGLSVGDLTQTPDAQALLGQPEQFWSPDDPLYRQYLDWLSAFVTLDWGTSQRFGEPVAALLAERARITAAYLIPAVLLGTVLSTAFGYLAALRRGGWSDRLTRTTSYVVLAVPNFVIGALLVRYLKVRAYELNIGFYDVGTGMFSGWNLFWLLIAVGILGTHIAAIQVRQVRQQSQERLESDFTKLLQAKGVGNLRFARHVLRAAAVPLTSLFVAEVLGLLLVSVFVIEVVVQLPGLGWVAWQAISINDGPLVLTLTFLISLTIILASLFEDIVAVVLDPRLDEN